MNSSMRCSALVLLLCFSACENPPPEPEKRSPPPVPTPAPSAVNIPTPTASAMANPPAPEPAKQIPAPDEVAEPPKDAKKTASGLFTKVLTKGKGKDKPKPEDRVKVHYTGWTKDGKMFD